jgi:hypothetical protein
VEVKFKLIIKGKYKMIKTKVMKGYKVTDKDMKCRDFQYVLKKEFKFKGEISIYSSGFHFCKNLNDCFSYYNFDSTNRVFEVESNGKILEHDKDSKVCTDNIKFIRELSWLEVLVLVNTGKNNTGRLNSGHRNSGHRNSGDSNSGHRNSGDSNSGHWNSGDSNSGDNNSGDNNSGDNNSGVFNTDEPLMRAFNKQSKIKYSDWRNSNSYIYFDIELIKWEDDKLITIEYKQAWANWWESHKSPEMIKMIKKLPNFNAKIFEEITGIQIK